MNETLDCLIVGAGISGLLAARELSDRGCRILVLDKSRGLGGRMSTRRQGEETFDQGAQFFTVRDGRFRLLVEGWLKDGVVTTWFSGTRANPHPRYRGVPGMTGLGKHLARGIPVERSAKVVRVSWQNGLWEVGAEDGRCWAARSVVLSAPAPQSLALLDDGGADLDDELLKGLRAIRYHPCLALMVTAESGRCDLGEQGWLRPESGPIAWMADNRVKGVSTTDRPALTLHADPAFSTAHYEDAEEEVTRLLLEAARPWLNGGIVDTRLHRWRFSLPAVSYPGRFASDSVRRLVFCGDGFGEPRVEGAALSGLAAADLISGLLD